jgi:3-hydroxymyristoyl/3-hydroxydecanoyl-(acyl carrier protein) dehydratase
MSDEWSAKSRHSPDSVTASIVTAPAHMWVPREELDRLCQSPVYFDALVQEEDDACILVKTVTMDDPGVATQRVAPRWPHHLPGELVIALTGQATAIALRRKGIVAADWRGHGVRIRAARFSAPVLVGERFFTRVEIVRLRRMSEKLYVQLRYRMWKLDGEGHEVETYRSEQDAMFFPGW